VKYPAAKLTAAINNLSIRKGDETIS
jgi:hypothetical protein